MSRVDVPALDRLVLGSAQQRLLAAAVPVSAAAFVACAAAAGASPAGWSLLLTAVLAVLAAAAPGSAGPLVLVLWLGACWGVGVQDPLSSWVLPAAGSVLVVHVASGLAAHGPAGLVLSRVTLVLWLRRCAALCVPIGAVWAWCAVLAGRQPPATGWLSGAALVVVTAAAAAATRRVSPGSGQREGRERAG